VGTSFALAGDDLRTLVDHLARYGHVRRGFLGVRMVQGEVVDATHPDDPFKIGVRVEEVVAGSPAALVGLRAGDLIVGWNGETLASPEDLMRRVEGSAPGARAQLVWVRGDDRLDGSLVVGAKPDDELLATPGPAIGGVPGTGLAPTPPPAAGGAQLPELRPDGSPNLMDRVRGVKKTGASPDTARRAPGGGGS
jgi:membrane-associated protease RseP (regulator of RpoE activity)